MKEIGFLTEKQIPTLTLSGRIDSTNVADAEQEVNRLLENVPGPDLQMDAEKLEYISSAGLRMLLRRIIRRNGYDTPEGRREIELYQKNIIELVSKLDDVIWQTAFL